MRTFRIILYTLAGLYMVYWAIRIQAEKFPHLIAPTILVLVIISGYIGYKYIWPSLKERKTATPQKGNKPARKTGTASRRSPRPRWK